MIKKSRSQNVLLVTGMVVALLLLQPLPYAHSEIIIDHFVNQQPPVGQDTQVCTSPAPPAVNDASAEANVIGGFRILQGNITNFGPGSFPPDCNQDSQLSIFVNGGGGGNYNFGLQPTVEGNGQIVYSGALTVGAFNIPCPACDFSASDHMTIGFVSIDHPFTINLDLYTDATHGSRASFGVTPIFVGTDITFALSLVAAGSYDSYFSALAPGAILPVDFSNIKEIRVNWVGPEALDFTIDRIVRSEANVDCVYKRINGQQHVSTTATPPFDVTISVSVINPGAEQPTPIVIRDTWNTVAAGNWAFVPGSVVVDSGPAIVGNPTTIGADYLEWDTSPSTLGSGQTLTFHYTVTILSLADGETKSNCVQVGIPGEALEQCTGICAADIKRTTQGKVPTMNEWGMIILSLILAGGAVWLIRRKRSV